MEGPNCPCGDDGCCDAESSLSDELLRTAICSWTNSGSEESKYEGGGVTVTSPPPSWEDPIRARSTNVLRKVDGRADPRTRRIPHALTTVGPPHSQVHHIPGLVELLLSVLGLVTPLGWLDGLGWADGNDLRDYNCTEYQQYCI